MYLCMNVLFKEINLFVNPFLIYWWALALSLYILRHMDKTAPQLPYSNKSYKTALLLFISQMLLIPLWLDVLEKSWKEVKWDTLF